MDRNAYVSALAELSDLREKPDASEAECQAWFEQHQSLVFPCLSYRHVIPHPVLETPGDTDNYIPDFIAQRHDGLWDIVEIKRPCTRLMRKATRRERFYTYISQCFEYCEFFDDSENRRRFERRHGFCPQKGITAILVAGRSLKLGRQKVFGLRSRFSKQIVILHMTT